MFHDIFDVVENSAYDHSSIDTKNHKSKDSYTDYFDYFYKTVQIDNRIFDLVVNVKRKYGDKGGFIYTIKVYDNEKIEASPALANNSAITSQGSPLSENDSIMFSPKSQAKISKTDLEKKYPKLNLNEDISKLDGIPAIRLTDGSVLHIDEIIEISKDLKKY